MRDSFIMYRSFYEAISDLPKEDKADILDAIFEYSLNSNEIELKGIPKTVFKLIKPILEANNKRYENGNKPKKPKQDKPKEEPIQEQSGSKTEANDNQNRSKSEGNKDKDVNEDKNEDDNKNKTPPPPRNLAQEELQKINTNRDDYLGEQETKSLLLESQAIYEHFARNTINDRSVFEKVINEFLYRSSADGKYPRPFKDSRSHFNNYFVSMFRSNPELFKPQQPKPQVFVRQEETPEQKRQRQEAEERQIAELRKLKEESDRRENENVNTKRTLNDFIPNYLSATNAYAV